MPSASDFLNEPATASSFLDEAVETADSFLGEQPNLLTRLAGRVADATQADNPERLGAVATDTVSRLAKDAVKGTGDALAGMGRINEQLQNKLVEINPLVPAGSKLEKRLKGEHAEQSQAAIHAGGSIARLADYYQPDKARDDTFAAHLAEFAGSAVPIIASGPAALATGAAMMGEQTRQNARAAGDSEEVANAKMILGTTVGAAAGAAPGSKLLARFVPAEAVLAAPLRAAATEIGGHALAAGATGTAADATLQALTEGQVDWNRAVKTGGLAAVIGTVGGALKAAEANRLAATDREGLFMLARKLGFEGNSIDELRQWHAEREAAMEILRNGPKQNAKPPAAPPSAEQFLTQGASEAGGFHTPDQGGSTPPPAPILVPSATAPVAAEVPPQAPPEAPAPVSAAGPASPGEPELAGSAPELTSSGGQTPPILPDQTFSRKQITEQRKEVRRLEVAARRAAETSPERAGQLTQAAQAARERLAQMQAQKITGSTPQVGVGPDGNPDLLTDIAQYVGTIRTSAPKGESAKGGEYDGVAATFGVGAARLLRDTEGTAPDEAVEILNESGYKFGSVGEFLDAVSKATVARRTAGARLQLEEYRGKVETAVLQNKGRKSEQKAPTPVPVEELGVGAKFEVRGEKFSIVDVEERADGLFHYVIQDGHKFSVPEGTPLYPDKGQFSVEQRVDPMEGWGADPASPMRQAPGQSDMFQGGETGGDTTFGLASETGKDFTGHLDEQARISEARRAQEAAQGRMFDEPPGTSGVGFPMPAAGMPPIPPGTPSANLNHGFMPAAMERIAPGTVDVPTVLDALTEAARAAGVTTDIREGRFYQKALGIAKSWDEVIRLRSLSDLPTAAHELGHIVMKGVFGSMKSRPLMRVTFPASVNKELTALGHALYGSRRPVAGYTAEGFAELLRLWLSTEAAPKKAPTATKWLEETLFPMRAANGPAPELGVAMRKAKDLFDTWRSQGAEARIGAQTKDEPGRIERLKQWAKQNLSGRAVAEEFAPLEELAKAYAATTGNQLAPGENPYMIATALRGTAGARLETWIEHGMTDINGTLTGPGLREAVAPIKARDAAKFEIYLTALQAIERLKQRKNPGIEREDAVYVRDKYAKAHPEFIAAAEKVADWWDGVLQYKRDAYPEVNGPIVDAVRRANPRYYGPLARVLDPERVRATVAAGSGGGLHRFKGSGLPIKKLVQQSLTVAEGMIADAHRDMILRSVVNLAETEGMGWVIEEVPRTRALEQVNIEKLRGQLEAMGVDTAAIPEDTILEYASHRDTPTGVDPIITVRTADKTRWYQVPAQVFEILQGVQEPARLGPLFELLAGMPSRAFKLGTTGLRASFSLVTNPARDLPTFMLQSITGNPASRLAAYLGALGSIVRAGLGGNQSPAWELVHQLGLQSSTFLGGDIAQTRREARSLFHGRWYRRVVNPVETLREILSFTESAPRLAELTLMARELGWKPGQPLTRNQAVALMVAFKRVTTDFAAKGSQWRGFYRAVPFSNAAVQGARSFGRSFKRDQGTKEKSYAALRAILNGLAILTLPAVYNWWKNKDEEWYNMLPWRERYLYLNVASGRNVYQIPMPPEWAASFATLPVALMDSWYKHDARPAREAMQHIFSVVNPLDYPVLAKVAKEQWENRIDFFDRPIVPRGEIDLLPGMQRSPYSSELAKELGDIFPGTVSPRRFDAAVRQVFGGVGSDVMDTPGALMRALGLQTRDKPRESEASDVPIFGRLARRGGQFSANSQPLVEFWDDYTRYGSWHASNQRAVRERQPVLAPMNFQQQAYAARLNALEPWIKLRLEIAERTPELAKRQAIYKAASDRAAKLIASRPTD